MVGIKPETCRLRGPAGCQGGGPPGTNSKVNTKITCSCVVCVASAHGRAPATPCPYVLLTCDTHSTPQTNLDGNTAASVWREDHENDSEHRNVWVSMII